MTFWRGSGSADLCLWLSDPYPAIFVIESDLQLWVLERKLETFLHTEKASRIETVDV